MSGFHESGDRVGDRVGDERARTYKSLEWFEPLEHNILCAFFYYSWESWSTKIKKYDAIGAYNNVVK
jgi:hypothetical protein